VSLTKNLRRTGKAGSDELRDFRESLQPPYKHTKLEELNIELGVKVGYSKTIDWHINYLKEKGQLTPEIEAAERAKKKANQVEIRKIKAKIRRLQC